MAQSTVKLFLGKDPDDETRPWLEWECQAYAVQELRRLDYIIHGDQNAGKRNPGKASVSGMLSGFPDLSVWLPESRVVLFELKRAGEVAKPHQKALHVLLKAFGFPVFVVAEKTPLKTFQKILEIIKTFS